MKEIKRTPDYAQGISTPFVCAHAGRTPEIGTYLYNVGFFMPEVILQKAHF